MVGPKINVLRAVYVWACFPQTISEEMYGFLDGKKLTRMGNATRIEHLNEQWLKKKMHDQL